MQKIAVIGMSCLFPGASTPEQFMKNLLENRDTTSAPTTSEMGVDPSLYYSPKKGETDKYYSVRGGYVRDFEFEASGFEIPAAELEKLDRIYQWSLYVAREALRDSGYLANRKIRRKCGLILGNLSFPTKSSNRLVLPIYHQVVQQAVRQLTGLDDLQLADDPGEEGIDYRNSRISGYPAALTAKALGLGAKYFSMDAACASSVYSVKIACDYLQKGKADLMLAGAVSAGDPLFINMGFSTFTAFPESGNGHPLDKGSGGLVSGEGAGMLVLKRLDDALADKDRIYAVINGIGLSNDGRGKSVLSPNPQGQVLAYERAYADSDTSPATVSYIECHATGTPVGDVEEIVSLDRFFGSCQSNPLIGSVKSNFGHLLTAAGMASIIKVILSMEKGEIPATIHVSDPVSSENGVIAASQVVCENRNWPSVSGIRCGAVNAFGFGGSNAHMILERYDAGKWRKSVKKSREKKARNKTDSLPPMAIVGMEAHFGICSHLNAFDHLMYSGQQAFRPLPEKRWKGIEAQEDLLSRFGFAEGGVPAGAFIEDFCFDSMRYRIPPNEVEAMIPQQLLMMSVADRAIQDACIKEGANVAVLIAMEADPTLHQFRGRIDLGWKLEQALSSLGASLDDGQMLNLRKAVMDAVRKPVQVNEFTSFIGNIMACRIASLWNFSGPAFTVSSEENAVFKALEVAQMMLANGEVEAVVVGGVDLAGNVEDVLVRNRLVMPLRSNCPSSSFEKDAQGGLIGEGAGAVVLKLPERARKEKDRCYAMIDAITIGADGTVENMVDVCQSGMQQAGVKSGEIGYLEITGTETDVNRKIDTVIRSYGEVSGLNCAMGSASASIGHCFAAMGIASLIKTALALYRRYIPAVPGWNAPRRKMDWKQAPFYVATESKSWFPDPGVAKRTAAVFSTGQDGTASQVILSEDVSPGKRTSSFLAETDMCMIPIAAVDRDTTMVRLNELREEVASADNLKKLVAEKMAEITRATNSPGFAVTIVGDSREKLLQEIDLAVVGVDNAFRLNQEWISPTGSCFTPNPMGNKGRIAFVFPGAFNSYLGMGKDLFQVFPELYDLIPTYSSHPERC